MSKRRTKKRPDPRHLPAYTQGEASHYLNIAKTTLRYWIVGRDAYKPLITPALAKPLTLSFINLVELHVLAAIRREHEVTLPKVRSAVQYLRKEFGGEHPLLSQRLATDGLNLFIERYGALVNISQDGQLGMRQVLEAALHRIERDAMGVAIKLYPFTRSDIAETPRVVVINPAISGGRPSLVSRGVATDVIAERYKAGEAIEALAYDYGCDEGEIEEALRCELKLAA